MSADTTVVIEGASAFTIALDGELAVFRAHEWRERLLEALSAAGERPLDVDLSGVSEVDGAGVQLLVALVHEAFSRGTPLAFVDPSQAVREAMGVAGLDLSDLAAVTLRAGLPE